MELIVDLPVPQVFRIQHRTVGETADVPVPCSGADCWGDQGDSSGAGVRADRGADCRYARSAVTEGIVEVV